MPRALLPGLKKADESQSGFADRVRRSPTALVRDHEDAKTSLWEHSNARVVHSVTPLVSKHPLSLSTPSQLAHAPPECVSVARVDLHDRARQHSRRFRPPW